jgi:DNA-binding response OmpR family regulator
MAQDTPTPSTPSAASNATILLIDDDNSIRTTYQMTFEAKGFHVLQAADGKAGLALAQEQHPDIIILDLMMPVMDGKQFLKAARHDETLKNTPIIVCTALLEDIEKQEIMGLGATEYLVKTDVDPDHLVSKVQSLLPKAES